MPQPWIGVIEGFYGREWCRSDRLAAAQWFAALGFDTYIYAPKSDRYLRQEWRNPFSPDHLAFLSEQSARYQAAGVRWGLGLSPSGINAGFSQVDWHALETKLAQIASCNPSCLAVLFDDMQVLSQHAAGYQAELIERVNAQYPAIPLLVCPSYYSEDPVLERLFGARPEGYIQTVKAALPSNSSVFWTGPLVCSEQLTQHDIDRAQSLWGDALVIWDNYPVNDGRERSQHLYLKPLAHRSEGVSNLSGHLCNPMNQPRLSLSGLSGLSSLHDLRDRHQITEVLDAVLGRDFSTWLYDWAEVFESKTLDEINRSDGAQIRHQLAQFKEPAVAEFRDWLEGGYAFDPACLT